MFKSPYILEIFILTLYAIGAYLSYDFHRNTSIYQRNKKVDKEDLTKAQMKKKDFDILIESIKQAGEIKRGKLKPGRVFQYDPIDIKSLRKKLHLSQSQFALLIGVSINTLQNWEQGRREPRGPAKALLRVASKHPKTVLEALQR